jgi:hypothetical protein
MPDSTILSIVAADCSPDIEDKFNQWYNEVHIPMLFPFKGLKKASRYQLAGENKGPVKYLAFYEFENEKALADFMTSPEFTAAAEEMKETWKDADPGIKWIAQYRTIKTWEK